MDTLIKLQVKALLIQKDYSELLRLCQRQRRFWRTLQLCLYETDENLRWPAIKAVAELLKTWWCKDDREKVQEYIRNLLWLLNEESGGISWSAPETIAETIVSIPELLEPYSSIMIARAFEGSSFFNGGLWAIGRLGEQIMETIVFFQDKVFAAFGSDAPETLGLAVWALGEANFTPALAYLTMFRDREELVRIYIDGYFQEKSLGNWSSEAIAKISK
ncbi:DVU0298 family protein [Chloroflexota bacterium]